MKQAKQKLIIYKKNNFFFGIFQCLKGFINTVNWRDSYFRKNKIFGHKNGSPTLPVYSPIGSVYMNCGFVSLSETIKKFLFTYVV